ncbi:MAG: hypothetical protein GX148_06035 [Clostridiales bacterium]|jgi:hypothetical protein|nr:hypothetical protein [Clostridiales bacterium]
MSDKKQHHDDDDGRTVANMNVEGLPWYKKNRASGSDGESRNSEKIPLTKQESKALLKGVLSASFLVGAIFFGVIALFILFCIFVWFK